MRPALPFRIVGLLLLSLASLLCIRQQALAAAPEQEVISITHADFIISDDASVPLPSAGWQPVALPHRSPKPKDRDLVGYWYRASFRTADTHQPLWLLFPRLRSGGAIFVNGIEIGEVPGADEQNQIRWFRPHLFFLPPLTLNQGSNEIAVRFAIREPLTSFGEILLGPEKPIRTAFDRFLFWETTTTDIASVICTMAGLLILVLWSRRRQENLYGVFGACVLLWGIRTFVFRMPEVPMAWWSIWRFFYYLTTSGFIVSITIFLMRFSETARPMLERVLLANWLGGSFAFLLIGNVARPFMDAYWTVSFLPFTLYAFACLLRYTWRRRTRSGIAMVLAILFAISLAIHDYAVQHGLFGLQEFYLLHLGIPAFLLVMAFILLERFIDSLNKADSLSKELTHRVAARERELAASYRRLSEFERKRATAEERQRIMQEMHDGVGSQLLSALVMVQRGAATQSETVALLQECLDDMRLAIDSLSPDDHDLLPVLGNFRYRMESRFKAMGLDMRWRNHDTPEWLQVAPHAGLQVMRILQELLTNVLKHAQATRVDVDLFFDGGRLRMSVRDNGVGIAAGAGQTGGHGLMNMQMRAKKIGAALRIERLAAGTSAEIDIPLAALAVPAAGAASSEPAMS